MSDYSALMNDSELDISNAVVDNLVLPNINANSVILTDGSNNVSGVLLLDGQLLIGRTANTPIGGSINGTVNQVDVTNAPGSITLSLPQDIATGSDPVFNSVTVATLQSAGVKVTGASNQITFQESKVSPYTILNVPKSSGNRTIRIPDVGTTVSTDFVMCRANQTIYGIKTFMSAPILSSLTASLPLKVDASNNVISELINLSSETSGTLPIARGGTNSSTALVNNKIMVSSSGSIVEGDNITDIVKTYGNQTISGYKTFEYGTGNGAYFKNGFEISDTTGGYDFCSVRYDPSAPPSLPGFAFPGTLYTVYIPRPTSVSGSANVLLNYRPDTIYAQLTFDQVPKFSTLSTSSLVATNASKEPQSVTISNSNGANMSFSGSTLTASNVQDIATTASPTFANITDNGLTANTIVLSNASKQLVSATVSSSTGMSMTASGTSITLNTQQDLRDISAPTFANVSLTDLTINKLISKSSVSGKLESLSIAVANGFTATVSTGTLTMYPNQDISTTALPTFASETLSATSNQLTLGTTRTVTINAPTPATASRTHTIPDVSANANFVMTEGAQTVNGVKTFGSGILLPTSGGTATSFSYYEEGTFALTTSGVWTVAQTINLRITRIGRIVHAQNDAVITGTFSSAGTVTTTVGTAFPARFRPSQVMRPFCVTVNNSLGVITNCDVQTNGTFTFYGATSGGGGFTAGVCQILPFCATWTI